MNNANLILSNIPIPNNTLCQLCFSDINVKSEVVRIVNFLPVYYVVII